MHAISHVTSRLKADKTVNTALNSRVAREQQWTRKGSVTSYSENHFNMIESDIPNEMTRANVDTIKAKVKNNVSQEFHAMWHNHIKTLVIQGRFLEILSLEQSHISWRSIIYNLPRGILKFAVNASIDTLATNANLKRWGKRSNAKCGLCQKRETLHHTLNNCETMLDRYLWRHNSIISYMHGIIKSGASLESNLDIYSDLPGEHLGASTVPIDILVTAQKPDIFIVDRTNQKCILFELSVPFEININSTHDIKVQRYKNLVSDLKDNGYDVDYYPVEIGSRGFISKDNENRLKSLLRKTAKHVKYNQFKNTVCKIVLISSFAIFHSKFEDSWTSPPYVIF